MEHTADTIWRNCLIYVQDNISPQAYKTWFLPIRPLKLQGKVITLQVPSKFVYEWLEAHYIKLLKSAITKELGSEARLVYSIVMDQDTAHLDENKVDIPSSNRLPIENPKVALPAKIGGDKGIKNPFVIPGLKKVNRRSWDIAPPPMDEKSEY